MKTLLVIIVTATVTVVIVQWRQEPAPFCCPGGKHVLMEGGKWKHDFPESHGIQDKGRKPRDR